MRCPFCRHPNIVGADTCDACGQPLEACAPGRKSPVEESLELETIAAIEPVPPICVPPTTSVAEAVRLLGEHNIGCVLVTWCDALIGIFSERDALLKIGNRFEELSGQPIRHFMTPAPETLTCDDPIVFALNRMAVGDFRHLPVRRGDRTVGIISARDVLRYVTHRYPEFADEAL